MKKVIDIQEVINVPVMESQGLLAFNLDAPETGTQIIDQQEQLTIYGILRDQSLVKMAEVMVKLGSDTSMAEVPLPQQDAESGVEGIKLKLHTTDSSGFGAF
ncbi:hypothetical protein PL11201_80018 [Planktothrix sp. PCC 11201]|uniref:hypothetical protein n=1 Tax=Planktothrix sp. PCC 11201 TaxID=1729650 RepID=UPI00091A6FEC|nr:hypothetical protein [Planktothrix sp. PCC 11201]SKB15709.1 hypothetical protein PL11201_80018 [Planktothrix sp. PCC 11201]